MAAVLALSVAAGGMTGCSSAGAKLASLNPFSKAEPSTLATPGSNSTTKVAGWTSGEKRVVAADETDPTSLAHNAEVTAEVFCANGRLWESTGNFEKAMESYAKALEKEPNDPAALSNIARLHLRQGNHKEAAEYFGNAIKQKPDDPGLYNDLGLALSKLGNHAAAATTIEQALRLSPGSSRFTNNLACVRFDGGDAEGAMQVLVENNKPAVAHFNMAYLHYKHGQKSESTRHLNQAIAYETSTAADPATKRAVERSKELLAQLGGKVPPSSVPPASVPPASVPSTTANATAIASSTSSKPAEGSPQDATSFTVSDSGSAGIGNAAYRTTQSSMAAPPSKAPTSQSAKPGSTPAAPSLSVPGAVARETAPAKESTSKTTFELPPGFQLP
ncbi:MAG: tetratricopeptide repeat protein [Planctomycetota bacterium]